MNKNDIAEAIRNVDSDIIAEAGVAPKKVRWYKIAIPAACAVLAAVIAVTALVIPGKTGSRNGSAGTIITVSGTDGVIKSKSSGKSDKKSRGRDYPDGPAPMAPGENSQITAGTPGENSQITAGTLTAGDQITAGTLTAGEWKDLANIKDWQKLVQDNKWYEIAQNRNIFSNHIIRVVVRDGESLCYNVPVKLLENNKVLWESRTDAAGEGFLCYNVSVKTENPTHVEVAGKKYSLSELGDVDSLVVDIKGAGVQLKELDLMLMVDTTGSMGDELIYIKEELKDVVSKVAKNNEQLSIRVSVNFYRDEEDEYIVKYFDFRTDIDENIKIISEQEACGGGDFPEAVHTALDNAVNGHQWRNDAVKLCFIVLDAPPHSESEVKGVNESLVQSLRTASKNGIRVIPVMCSGGDDDTEYTLRSFAVLTGGTFVFLTDDSGIGYSHQEVTVGDHEIETLNECMTRIICEYVTK